VVVDAKNRIWGEVYRTETKKAATDPTWDESFVLEKQLG
jgi:Ca2+-dependent lipid-binding protein